MNGLWSPANHESMAKDATVDYNIDGSYIRLMQRATKLADDDDYEVAGKLHGKKNYVRTLKFLYNCAQYLREGKSIKNSLAKAEKDAGISNDSKLVEVVTTLLKSDILPNISENSGTARYFKVMGFAMHVVGDTFAHRTIVPTYTMNGTNPLQAKYSTSKTSAASRFGSNDFSKVSHTEESESKLKQWALNCTEENITTCRRWSCFQRAVRLGVVEFRDVKHFSLTTVGAVTYEDRVDFCTERYVDAKIACSVLFSESYDKCEFDGIFIFYPSEQYVKLNNLKNYAKAIGEDTSYFTSKEWEKMSTPKEY